MRVPVARSPFTLMFAPLSFVYALCGLFVAAMSVALVHTVSATLRRGRPLVSWLGPRAGLALAVPFAAALGLALVASGLAGPASDDAVGTLLTLGTALGTAAAVLAATVGVTEEGVFRGTGHPLVRWDEVEDYVDRGRGGYGFFVRSLGAPTRRRVDLVVPPHARARFDAIASACAEARLARRMRRPAPVGPLEG